MGRPEINFTAEMTPETKRRLIAQVGVLAGVYEVDIKPRRAIRSNAQNRYFHGVLVPMFRDYLQQQEFEQVTLEAAKGFIKAKHLLQELVSPETGEVIGRCVRSTAELTTEEFTDFIERSRAWLASFFGLVIPDPEPDCFSQHSKQVATAAGK